MADEDKAPQDEDHDQQDSVVVPSHKPLPLPPDVTYTRPTLGRGTPSTQASSHGRSDASGQGRNDANLLAQGARGYGVIITAALTLAISLGIFVMLGQWLDHRYNSSPTPWFTIVGVLLGIVGGFGNMIRLLMATSTDKKSNK